MNSIEQIISLLKAIVGGLMYANSASFIEDIPKNEEIDSNNRTEFTKMLTDGYNQAATNCFGAVALYGGCLIFCLIQVWFNVKLSEQNQIR